MTNRECNVNKMQIFAKYINPEIIINIAIINIQSMWFNGLIFDICAIQIVMKCDLTSWMKIRQFYTVMSDTVIQSNIINVAANTVGLSNMRL